MYTIKNLSKYFYDESWRAFFKNNKIIALNNLNIDFTYGDSIGVIGKNGSGKSTLLKIIGNILLADEAYFSFDKNKAQTSYISGNERAFLATNC